MMDTKISADRANTSITATKAATQPKSPSSLPEIAQTKNTTNDVVDLSEVAQSLSSDVLKVFNSLSTEDKTRLVNLVNSGAISGRELNDGILGSLKSDRKRQLWSLVSDKIAPSLVNTTSGKDAVAEIEKEGEALKAEHGKLLRELADLAGKPGKEAEAKAKNDLLQKLADRTREVQSTQLMDITKPMTFVGARGTFFSANWVEKSESDALSKLTALGGLSQSVQQVISEEAKKSAKENLVVYSINGGK